jgi:hypothetical protein
VDDDRNEADAILGSDRMDPRHANLIKALRAHPERERIMQWSQETGEDGERRWSLCQVAADGWVELWLSPSPVGRFEERPSIRVGAWPEREDELDPFARARVIVEEQDDAPR